jgi:hypothetical protein
MPRKTNPILKKFRRGHDRFNRLIGECTTRWAFIDAKLFEICSHCLAAPGTLDSIVYYRTPMLKQRLALVDELLKAVARHLQGTVASNAPVTRRQIDELPKQWAAINKKLDALIDVRNVIVHQPMKIWSIKNKEGHPPRHEFLFVISSDINNAMMRNRKQWTVTLSDLQSHFQQSSKMIRTLDLFLGRLRHLQARQAKRAEARRKNRFR